MATVDHAVGFAHDCGTRLVGPHVAPLPPRLSEGIAEVVHGLGCGLAVKAPHGKTAGHAMPGSQTTAALSHSPVPALVLPPCRA
ncbi:hypothetical protein ASF77_04045 [Massilia sp. Leaf139]|nr:hypothetical protein ASF77_04045 [Massilia sp. Leaf139]